MRLPVSLFAVVLVALAIGGCAKAGSRASDDATITTRVKVVLLDPTLSRADRIEVSTFKGVVTLSGRVSTKQEAERAIALARTIRGVKDVKSALQIIPTPLP